ncbi:MAG: hypothetical protein VX429_03355 [Nitrospinota bacterium]|nr:hypothetical protein [Nitrospinota bacterium]
MKKIRQLWDMYYSKIRKALFYVFEPFLRVVENIDSEVRRHFNQALLNLKNSKQAIALLNLNMVISLKPNHFLARVFRGRIYVRQGQYRLASEDYLEANRISHYRFIHYDLYREYFKSVNNEFGAESGPILQNFNEVFDSLNSTSNPQYWESNKGREFKEKLSLIEADKSGSPLDFSLTVEEKEKFRILGPISQQEVEETDWDSFMDELNS